MEILQQGQSVLPFVRIGFPFVRNGHSFVQNGPQQKAVCSCKDNDGRNAFLLSHHPQGKSSQQIPMTM